MFKMVKECKHLLKYNSEIWTCGIDMQGSDGKAHCGRDVQTGEYVIYRRCSRYEPVEKRRLSIAEKIIKDTFKEKKS